MSSNLQSLKLYGVKGQLNPNKVALVLTELRLPFEFALVPFADVKKPEFLNINPNGRTPALYDPNRDITLFESGAIIEYVLEVYDKERRHLSFEPGTNDSFFAKQWFMFQLSGQGPYYGQLGWFKMFHSEQLPSAIERYAKEVNRVSAVLEDQLAKQKELYSVGPWLVGGKMSYADLAFVPWQRGISKMCKEGGI